MLHRSQIEDYIFGLILACIFLLQLILKCKDVLRAMLGCYLTEVLIFGMEIMLE